jgi:hypothetical protein
VKPSILAAAAVSLLAVGALAYVMNSWTHVDASAGLADFAKAEEGRRAAEARASQATDALAIAVKARQEAEAAVTAAVAAQTKSEESRRAAETRAGEAADTLAKADKARQDAEAKATAAAAALIKTEESRRATEATANFGSEALKKSERARLDAEARATSAAAAQAIAEEGQRTADKARSAAETAASAAATARNQGEAARQLAELRANDAADALKKSEKARQEAEAKLAALTKAEESRRTADLRPAPGPSAPAVRPATGSQTSSSRQLLAEIGSKSRWAVGRTAFCNSATESFFSLEIASNSISWVDGLGSSHTETIVSSNENSFYTKTTASLPVSSKSRKWAETCSYWRQNNSLFVQPATGPSFYLERCP